MDDEGPLAEEWRRPAGIFVIIEVRGPAFERILQIQQAYDPKLAATRDPHLTLIGSSGVGPIAPATRSAELRAALEPIARTTPSFELRFGPPERFMQRDVVVLPLDPHGPLRALHDRIARSGLTFQPARFTFTPHVTLNLFASLTPNKAREIMRERVGEPLRIDHLKLSLTDEPDPPRDLFELPLLPA